jgi:hypothetical protein
MYLWEISALPDQIIYFVSYAHQNKSLATDFLRRLADVLAPSKAYRYTRWMDSDLILGEDWHRKIQAAINSSDVGFLLISPAFLPSKYIKESELPSFVVDKKAAVPVMLQRIDFQLHDLRGLEKKQIFLFDYEGFKEPRSYVECKGPRRDDFVLELFRQIERKLAERTKGSAHEKPAVDPLLDLRLFELASRAYRLRGTPKYFLDSQSLTKEQRAELYDRVLIAGRGHASKHNPYLEPDDA